MSKSTLSSILSGEKIQTAFLLFLVLFIGFYNLSRTDELRYVDEKAKSITSNVELQKELIETNKKYYRDENEQTYLIGPDPYLYYRIARNLVELGTINDSVNSQMTTPPIMQDFPADSLRFSPIGTQMQKEFMPYVVYYFHKVWNFFSTATLSRTAFYLPVFLGLISIASVFFLVLTATKNKINAFFSSFLLAMHPTFVAFNFGGYTDTHIIAMTLSLMILFLFITAFKAKNVWIKLLSVILTILTVYLFKFSWRGWFFVIALMGIYSFFETVNFVKNFKINKNNLMIATSIFILLIGFAAILYQNNAITSTIDRVLVSKKINEIPQSNFGTVNELQSLSLSTLSNYFGGVLIVILILIASLNILRKQNRTEPFYWFILIWFLAFVVLGKFSMRFLFFVAPPSAILLGLLCEDLVKYFKNFKQRLVSVAALFILFSLILYPTISEVWQNGPMMNDAIEETGLFLQQNSPKNSVLNVWWNSGYYWQTFARRGTTMDGGLFETQMPFYFANGAVTNNSELSKKLNLMAGCGIATIPDKKTFENKTIEKMLTNLTSEANFSKCKNEVYLIIDERTFLMTPTFYLYSQKSNNEEKSTVDKILEKESFSFGGFTAKDVPYISPIINCDNINNEVIKCENHIVDTQKITFKGNPLNSLIVIKNSERKEKYYNPEATNVSLIVFQEKDNKFRAVLMDKKIKDSVLIRLFSGEKVEGFDKAYETNLPIKIVTYKIDPFNS